MSERMLAVGTQFLHETGVVRFFGDARKLAFGGGGDATVYLSAQFMVSVMKGLVRHDRQALQDFFVETGNKLMLRRTNRLNATGRLHESLVPFLWPMTDASRAYWDWVRRQGHLEAELWPTDLVANTRDMERALELLEGFALIVRLKDDPDLLVPGVLPAARTQLSADAFASDAALPFTASRTYPVMPAGAFLRIVARVVGQVDWGDFSTQRAVFCKLGNVATIAWSDMASVGAVEKRAVLRWRASNKHLRAIIAETVDKIERFFPGLHRMDHQEDTPMSAREPAQVLILAASQDGAALVEAAVKAAVANDYEMINLALEVRVATVQQMAQTEPGRVRVLLVCMTPEFSASSAAVEDTEAYMRLGKARVVTLLLAGFNSSPAQWGSLQQLSLQPSVDLRACSMSHAHMQAEVHKQVEEERSRLSGGGQSAQPKTQDKEEQVKNKMDERLGMQERDAVEAVRSGLLPHVNQLLRKWRPQSTATSGLTESSSTGAAVAAGYDVVWCDGGGGKACAHTFSRTDLEAHYTAATHTGDHSKVASICCPQCNTEHMVRELLVSPVARACPACVRKGAAGATAGFFCARECRLRMGERLEQRIYAEPCKVCGELVNLFDVFPPEVFCSLHISADGLSPLVSGLIKSIEIEADVLVWPARREAHPGGGPDAESRRALALAQVVLLVVTEKYAACPECAAEALEALKAGKLIVPVLMPDFALSAEQALPLQGTGPEEVEVFWRELFVHRRDRLKRQDALDWTILGDRTPLAAAVALEETWQQSVFAGAGKTQEARLDDLACAVAAHIASRLHRAVKVEVFSDLSRFGVRLSFFHAFVERFGGRLALENLSTFEVMKRFVKPWTSVSKLSLCEHLISDDKESKDGAIYVATAKVFLSHAWKCRFLDVVDAVERRFLSSAVPDPVVWFDVFSVSQHRSDERDFTWWNSTFLNAVGSMGEVVVVLQPWRAPVPLTRVWCIFEAYAAEATRSHFSIAVTEAEASDLVNTICSNPSTLLATLRRICCEASTATQAEDRELIFDNIRQSVGFVQLDSMIASRMIEAVCAELCRQLDNVTARATPDGQAAQAREAVPLHVLLHALAQLRVLQQNHAEAERLYRECLVTAGDLGTDLSVRASIGIAAACSRQKKGEDAIKTYRSLLQVATLRDSFLLEANSGLALECYANAELCEEANFLAEKWETDCLDKKCGAALHNFGRLRLEQGRAVNAELLLRAGVDALREQMGEWSPLLPWHPDTLEAMASIAATVEAQGRWVEAEEGLRGLLALRERFLPPDHMDTKATRTRLAALCRTSGDGAGVGPGALRLAKSSLPPGLHQHLSESGHDTTVGEPCDSDRGGGRAVDTSTTVLGILEGLWQDWPSLALQQILQLQELQGLDRVTCCCLAVKALGSSYLRSVDLRCLHGRASDSDAIFCQSDCRACAVTRARRGLFTAQTPESKL
uniref:TIR domain-containing protein n=1 Tax=Cryptomonas curvata TaxID=233186 RepID=A0A7S0QJD3_9CRYP